MFYRQEQKPGKAKRGLLVVKIAGQPAAWEPVKEPSTPEPSFLRSPTGYDKACMFSGHARFPEEEFGHVATLIPQCSRTKEELTKDRG